MRIGKKNKTRTIYRYFDRKMLYLAVFGLLFITMIGSVFFMVNIVMKKVYPAYTFIRTETFLLQKNYALQSIHTKLFEDVHADFIEKTTRAYIETYPPNPFIEQVAELEKQQEKIVASTTLDALANATTSLETLPELPEQLP